MEAKGNHDKIEIVALTNVAVCVSMVYKRVLGENVEITHIYYLFHKSWNSTIGGELVTLYIVINRYEQNDKGTNIDR